MSVKVMSMVFEHYPEGGSEMLLALAFADFSNDEGTSIYPSVAALAKKTRQSERSVQYQIQKMTAKGFLTLVEAGGREGKKYRANEYRINFVFFEAIKAAKFRGAEVAPLPSVPLVTGNTSRGATSAPLNLAGIVGGAKESEEGCNLAHLGVQSDALGGAIAVAPQPPYTTIIPTTTTSNTEAKRSADNQDAAKAVVVANVIFPPETHQLERESTLAALVGSGVQQDKWQQIIDELTGARANYTVRTPVGFVRELAQRTLVGKFIPEYGVAVAQARVNREQYAKTLAAQIEAEKRTCQQEGVDLEASLAKVPQHLRAKLEKRLVAAEKNKVSQL